MNILKSLPTDKFPLTPAPPVTFKEPVVGDVDAILEVAINSDAPMAEVDGIVKFLLIDIDIYYPLIAVHEAIYVVDALTGETKSSTELPDILASKVVI